MTTSQGGWPNGKALDFGSRDCRFDPCVARSLSFLVQVTSGRVYVSKYPDG